VDAGGAFPEIADYAVIGNCRTAALVSRDGAVEWMCLPTFSDASLFSAILDRKAGHFWVRPSGKYRSARRYIEGTNVLETTFVTQSGTLRVTDCMSLPVTGSGRFEPQHELLRSIECTDGEVEVEVSFAPRADYGRRAMGFEHHGRLGWRCARYGCSASLLSDIDLSHDEQAAALHGRARLHAGERRWLSFAFDAYEIGVIPPLRDEARTRLDATTAWWRSWSGRCHYDGPYREEVRRSALALKLMTSCTTGAVLAAPTTSLPEVAGGPRNWDYRFCWIRDSALVLHAFLSLGYVEEAEAFLEWLLHATRLTWQRFQVMYDLHGETKLNERELPHLSGYRGAKPVRIGNAAHDQLQLDIYGELLESVALYVSAGGSLDATECRMLAGVGRSVMKLWTRPDQGIWETRSEPRHHTFSKAMCWVALDRLAKLGERFPIELDRAAVMKHRDAIRKEIETRGFDEEAGSYVAYYGGRAADASLLLLARYGYCEPGNARMEGTWRFISKSLMSAGMVHRYRPEALDDGVEAAPENAFAPCNFWAAEYLANAGHDKEAKELFERYCAMGNDVGLFAEEMDSATGAPVGNFPQAFTHVSLISAATALYKHPTA
jgi:GH15 family glucan-1,4-alpha-glucosidase